MVFILSRLKPGKMSFCKLRKKVSNKASIKENQSDKKEIKKLKKELRRMEKALAETAVLLVLSKKSECSLRLGERGELTPLFERRKLISLIDNAFTADNPAAKNKLTQAERESILAVCYSVKYAA
jgi:hypothetical protein